MAISYTYFELENFPSPQVGQEIQTTTQLAIPQLEDDSIHTIVRFLGDSEHPDFFKFHVTHETIRKIKARFLNNYRERIIEVMEFNLFMSKTGPASLVTASTQYCHEMFRRLEQTLGDLSWKERKVDLISLKKELGSSIRGGWFTGLKIADVRVAAIFGPTVGESEEWDRYEHGGDCSALVVELYSSEEAAESVMITRSGSIVLYGTFSEGNGLRFVSSINEQIAPFSQVYSVGLETKRRQKT